MNSQSTSQSNVLSDFPTQSRTATTPAAIPFTQQFIWSVRREIWENPSLYIAPLLVAGLILIGFMAAMIHLRRGGDLAEMTAAQHTLAFQQPYTLAALLLMGVTFIVSIFYCLDALYGERRDRSILFWKSLPVSDLTTILSKIVIPLILIPILTFAITLLTQAAMLLVSLIVFLGSGANPVTTGAHPAFLQMSSMLFFHMLAIHGLWYAPIYAWLLLASAWARRAPLLWAVLPPIGLGILERFAFHTNYFAQMIANRVNGAPAGQALTERGMMMAPLTPATIVHFVSSPGLWIGLAVAAIFLAAAITLRRRRDPM